MKYSTNSIAFSSLSFLVMSCCVFRYHHDCFTSFSLEYNFFSDLNETFLFFLQQPE